MIDDSIEVPEQIIKANKNIILCVDIMYIQGLIFLTTISIDLKFRTIKYIPNWKESTIFQAIDEVF